MNQTNTRPPRLTPEAWTRAREDFLAGVSAAVVAERYGTTERNVRRRAALEGWRRRDFMPGRLSPPPPWIPTPRTKDEEIEIDPALGEVDEAETVSRFALLFNPQAGSLRRFAFRQAAENAAVDRPQQAISWMRLVHLVNNCDARLESDSSAFREIDHIRAAYLRSLHQALEERRAEEDASAAEAAMAETPE